MSGINIFAILTPIAACIAVVVTIFNQRFTRYYVRTTVRVAETTTRKDNLYTVTVTIVRHKGIISPSLTFCGDIYFARFTGAPAACREWKKSAEKEARKKLKHYKIEERQERKILKSITG